MIDILRKKLYKYRHNKVLRFFYFGVWRPIILVVIITSINSIVYNKEIYKSVR